MSRRDSGSRGQNQLFWVVGRYCPLPSLQPLSPAYSALTGVAFMSRSAFSRQLPGAQVFSALVWSSPNSPQEPAVRNPFFLSRSAGRRQSSSGPTSPRLWAGPDNSMPERASAWPCNRALDSTTIESKTQGGHQSAHPDGLAWQYPVLSASRPPTCTMSISSTSCFYNPVLMDRAYTDFARLYTFTRSLAAGSRQKAVPRQVSRSLGSSSAWSLLPTFTSAAGVWSQMGSRPSLEPPKTPSKPRSGSPSALLVAILTENRPQSEGSRTSPVLILGSR